MGRENDDFGNLGVVLFYRYFYDYFILYLLKTVMSLSGIFYR